MSEVRKISRQILAAKNETPACEAGESANNKGMDAIVACVPCGADVHLAAMRERQAGLDMNHAANVREHCGSLRSMAALLGAKVVGEVQL